MQPWNSRDVNIFIDIIPGTIWKASPFFGGVWKGSFPSKTTVILGSKNKLYRNHSKLKVTRTKLSHCHDHFRFATEAVEAFRGLPTISRGGAWWGSFTQDVYLESAIPSGSRLGWRKERGPKVWISACLLTAGCSHSWRGMWNLAVSPLVWEESYSYLEATVWWTERYSVTLFLLCSTCLLNWIHSESGPLGRLNLIALDEPHVSYQIGFVLSPCHAARTATSINLNLPSALKEVGWCKWWCLVSFAVSSRTHQASTPSSLLV